MAEPLAAMLSWPGEEGGALPSGGGAGCRVSYRADMDEIDEGVVVRHYMPLVKRTALHLKGRLPETVQLDDLIQAGAIAVLRIFRRGGLPGFGNPHQALRRSIVNAMIDEARREVWAPVRTLRLAKAAAIAMRAVQQRLGRDGSDEEIAAEMRLGLAEYQGVLVEIAGIRLLQIDEIGEDEERIQFRDHPDFGLDKTRLVELLARSIAALPCREKMVMALYYEHELNMDEVGKVLGIDKATVSRAHGRALLILKGALAGVGAAGVATESGGAVRRRPGG